MTAELQGTNLVEVEVMVAGEPGEPGEPGPTGVSVGVGWLTGRPWQPPTQLVTVMTLVV